MENIDFKEIVEDTHADGLYVQFYEGLQNEINNIPQKRINDMLDTLIFDNPDLMTRSMGRLEILYKYSCLL